MSDTSPVNSSAETSSVQVMKKTYEDLSKKIETENTETYKDKSLGLSSEQQNSFKESHEVKTVKKQLNHKVTIKLLFANTEFSNIDISEYFTNIKIIKNYDSSFKPIYFLNFNMPLYIINSILKSKNYKFRLIIETVDFENTIEDISMGIIDETPKFNKVLDIFIIPFTTPDNIINETATELLSKEDETAKKTRFDFKIEGFDERHVRTAHSLISTNYRNQTLLNIIIDLINKNKNNCMPNIENLILAEPDTSEFIDNLTIPPLGLKDALVYIHEVINIYKRKPIFFVEDNTLYIIKRGYSPKLKDGTNPMVNLVIGNTANIEKSNINSILKSLKQNNMPILLTNVTPKFTNKSAEVANTIGDKIMIKSDTSTSGLVSGCLGIVDSDPKALDSVRYATSDAMTNTSYDGKEIFKHNSSNARFDINLMIDDAQARSFNINIKILNARLDLFKPITRFNIKFGDIGNKDYEGQYYIKDLIAIYEKNPRTDDITSVVEANIGRRFDENQQFIK